MKTIQIPLFALVGVVMGCSGSDDKIDIGDRNVAEIGAKLTDYAGTWDGYAETYHYPSGSDRVRITLDAGGNGTVEFGDAPPLVMPSDPHIGFPPIDGDTERAGTNGVRALSMSVLPLKEGFDYTVADSSLEERRFRFGVATGEIIAPWCELQTPIEWSLSPGEYLCAPSSAQLGAHMSSCSVTEMQGGVAVSVPANCDWLERCFFGHCACDASGCTASASFGNASFDGTLENGGSDLVGTLSFPDILPGLSPTTTRVTVRLSRTP